MEDQSGETVLYDKVALRFKGGCFFIIFPMQIWQKTCPLESSTTRCFESAWWYVFPLSFDRRTPSLSTWTITSKSPISRCPVFSPPSLHSRYPHRALRHLGQRPQGRGAPTNRQQRRHSIPSQRKLVDICVNLGIKPQIHYYNCYPCDRIADLFYQSVGSRRLAHL